jgi:hypothetical protein
MICPSTGAVVNCAAWPGGSLLNSAPSRDGDPAHRRGVRPGRADDRLRGAGHRQHPPLGGRAGQAGVGVRGDRADRRRPVGAQRALDVVAEPGARVAAADRAPQEVADLGAQLRPGLPAVVAAGVPDRPDLAARRGDLPRGGVGLVEPEERVAFALDQQRRHGDLARHRRGGDAAQQVDARLARLPGGAELGVGAADGGGEPAARVGRPALAPAARTRGRGGDSSPRGAPGGAGRAGVGGLAGFGGFGRRRTTGRRTRARREEDAGPALLEHAVGGERAGGRGARRRQRGRGRVRDQALREVVVGDHRGDRVDALVRAGQQQRERAAVGRAGDGHLRVAARVGGHLVLRDEPVDQAARVGDLAVRVVEPDLAGALAEPARGPRHDDEALPRQLARVVGDAVLVPAEPVREQHRGRGHGGGQVGGRVDLDLLRRAGGRGHVDHGVLRGHRRGRGGPRDPEDRAGGQDHDDGGERGEAGSAGARERESGHEVTVCEVS